jgi:hypothetical protein
LNLIIFTFSTLLLSRQGGNWKNRGLADGRLEGAPGRMHGIEKFLFARIRERV